MSNKADDQIVYTEEISKEGGNQQDNSFPTTTMSTVVGDVKVSDKSFGIGGQVVDSTGDTPIDVNALYGVSAPPEGGLAPPATGYDIKLETSGHGASDPVSKNPNQSFLKQQE